MLKNAIKVAFYVVLQIYETIFVNMYYMLTISVIERYILSTKNFLTRLNQGILQVVEVLGLSG